MIEKEFPISDQAGLFRRCAAEIIQIAEYTVYDWVVFAVASSLFWHRLQSAFTEVSRVCSIWAPGNTTVYNINNAVIKCISCVQER